MKEYAVKMLTLLFVEFQGFGVAKGRRIMAGILSDYVVNVLNIQNVTNASKAR